MTRKKIVFCVLCLYCLFTFLTCKKEEKPKTIHELQKLNLSQKEKDEDYEFFWGFIKEGFPFTEVLERNGVDLKKIKEEWQPKLKDIETKSQYLTFYGELCAEITQNKPVGHLYPIDYQYYNKMYKTYYPCVNKDGTENELIKDFYSAQPSGAWVRTIWNDVQQIEGITTYIVEEGKIACLRIDSFSITDQEKRKKFLNDVKVFLEKTKDHKHLIIDITRNGGGDRYFWMYITGLLLKDNAAFYRYGLYTENKYTKELLEYIFKIGNIEIINKDKIPNVKNTNTAHKNGCKIRETIKKIDGITNSIDERKIWLLVSSKSHSAADQFAGFCRQTGFATVVGENTAGAGMSVIGPLPIPLPKSGALILFDSTYALNTEGMSNTEFGTAPDIHVKDGQVPMQACMEAIREYDAKEKK
ncbi:S41 family peptidase [Treponema putidum]|uniref:S41 family peptidase n=1 Tax=Treponema putidum TaxID=221027 RepID=UPI003D90576A